MSVVYLLYEESGEYSDYRMGILGVFSSVELAKLWLEKDCIARAAREATFMPESLKTDWTKRTPWSPYEAGEIEWHCSLDRDAQHPSYVSYGRKDWTIAPFILDGPEELPKEGLSDE